VPTTAHSVPSLTDITTLPSSGSYKYMGVWLNLKLCWAEQAAYMCKKVVTYIKLIHNRRLTTDHQIILTNMVMNAFVAYSMCVVPFAYDWVKTTQDLITRELKSSMGIASNMDNEPFFMPISEGGRGLTNLHDLQTAISCACTLQEMTSISLSARTTAATWHHAFTTNDSAVARWVAALKTQGWQAWPRWRDLDWVGNYVNDPALAHALVAKGLFRWSDVLNHGMLLPLQHIVTTLGVALSPWEYQNIAVAVANTLTCPAGPVAVAEARLCEVNHFSMLPEELTDLHFHYPSHTLTIFMDASCLGESSAGAVFYGNKSHHNRKFSIPIRPISMLAELHAIEEALLSAPCGVNLCIATDSLAAINSIKNWCSWSLSRKRKFVGEAIVRRIHGHISDIASAGRTVTFQHLYSHIPDKKRKARDAGPLELAKLKGKLRAMKDRLWGDHVRWIEGNVGADALAGVAHGAAPTHLPWTMGQKGQDVVLFNQRGREVTGNVQRIVAKGEAHKWPERMRRKPTRGRFLRDKHTDYRATYSALDPGRGVSTGRMANFLHKARYGALPVKAVRHHHYWRRTPSGSVPAAPPTAVRGEDRKLSKWYARQTVYADQMCGLCGTSKETSTHPFSSECLAQTELATETASKVQSLIRDATAAAGPIVTDIPLWFHAGEATQNTAPCEFEPFARLRAYDKDMGSLGYVPTALKDALVYYGTRDTERLVANIAVTIAQGAHARWTARCKTLVASEVWSSAHRAAKERVASGQ
jgi:ribonuclease HI